MTFKALAPAKINLTLDILNIRPDGYHEVAMLMQTVSLYDTLTLTVTEDENIVITCSDPDIPCNESNIVFKAAKAFFNYTRIKNTGLSVHIEKTIPCEAGLAGGSADGAAMLRLLNIAFGANLSDNTLCEIGATVGADVPFCIVGGTRLATGTGTTLNKVRHLPGCYIVIVKPDVSVSTKEAYALADSRKGDKFNFTNVCKDMLYRGDIRAVASTLHNDFEEVLNLEDINEIKKLMYKSKALGAAMSGSGSAVFALFQSKRKALKCVEKLSQLYSRVYLTEPVKSGAAIIE